MAMFIGMEIWADLAAQAVEMSFAAWWVRVGEGATRGGCEDEDEDAIIWNVDVSMLRSSESDIRPDAAQCFSWTGGSISVPDQVCCGLNSVSAAKAPIKKRLWICGKEEQFGSRKFGYELSYRCAVAITFLCRLCCCTCAQRLATSGMEEGRVEKLPRLTVQH